MGAKTLLRLKISKLFLKRQPKNVIRLEVNTSFGPIRESILAPMCIVHTPSRMWIVIVAVSSGLLLKGAHPRLISGV